MNNYNPEPTHPTAAGETKYKGVRQRKWGKWVAEIRLPNSRERIWLGSYDSQEKAARAFDAALFCLRGRHAKFNFPDQPLPDIPDAHSLTPHQIQRLAAKFANETQSPSAAAVTPTATVDDPRGISSSSSSASVNYKDDEHYMDWSFLDKLDAVDDLELRGGGSTTNLSPLYSDHFDNVLTDEFYHSTHHHYDAVSPHYEYSITNQSFLWNFDDNP